MIDNIYEYETKVYKASWKTNGEITIKSDSEVFNCLTPEKLFSLLSVDQKYDSALLAYRQMDYDIYLLTKHWDEFRKMALKHFNNRCQACGSVDKKLNVHHNNYLNLGKETFDDVVVLCEECHAKFHKKQA